MCVLEMSLLRMIPIKDEMQTSEILNIVKDIVEVIRKRKRSYLGHVALMNSERYPSVVLRGIRQGKIEKKTVG